MSTAGVQFDARSVPSPKARENTSLNRRLKWSWVVTRSRNGSQRTIAMRVIPPPVACLGLVLLLPRAPGPTALPPSDDTEDYGALLLRCSSGLRPTLRLSHLNLDGLGLGFLTLGQGQGQNDVLVLGLNMLRVDRIGQREGTRKASVAPLDAMITLLFHV